MSLNTEKSIEISVTGRYIGDICPIFFDFFTERFSIAKIVSFGSDIRYIADISADISEISNSGFNNGNIVFSLVRRYANVVAQKVARVSLSLTGPIMWAKRSLDFLHFNLLSDLE